MEKWGDQSLIALINDRTHGKCAKPDTYTSYRKTNIGGHTL